MLSFSDSIHFSRGTNIAAALVWISTRTLCMISRVLATEATMAVEVCMASRNALGACHEK